MPIRLVKPVLAAAGVLLLVVLVWTAVVLLVVRDDLRSAQDAFGRLDEAPSTEAAQDVLATATPRLESASSALDQLGPRVASGLPVVGRTVGAVRRTSAAALALAHGSSAALAAFEEPLLQDGRLDLDRAAALGDDLRAAADGSRAAVAALREQDLGLVPAAVARPAGEALPRLERAQATLESAAAGVTSLAAALGRDGPQDWLVLLENNAELRGTGGIVTVFAQAAAEDGRLEIESFADVEEVADGSGSARPVPAPDDYLDLYGDFQAASTLWKNTNMSPDVPTSSQVIAEVSRLATGTAPDVVLWLDVRAIEAVLRAVGPVDLPDGTTLGPDDVVARLLSGEYAGADDTAEGQAARRADLRAAADAAVGQVLGDGADPGADDLRRLATELGAAARGRHLALWSADPAVQDGWETAGWSGSVAAEGGDLSALTVHNLGGGDRDGNKLDFYGRRQSTVEVEVGEDSATVVQDLALRSTAPASGLPVYVAGRVTPGVMNSFVTLSLPREAQDVVLERDGRRLSAVLRPEADHAVVTDVVTTPPGATTQWRLSYRVPVEDGRYRLRLYPQPLAVDSGVRVALRGEDGLPLRTSSDGPVRSVEELVVSGPFDEVQEVAVDLDRGGALSRLRRAVVRFWQEPVSL